MLFHIVPKVEEIYIADMIENPPPAGGHDVCVLNQMYEISEAKLVAGKGIVGDRWFGVSEFRLKSGENKSFDHDRHVSLIEKESINKIVDLGFDILPKDLRRNFLTVGISLEGALGKKFKIGNSVILEGTRLCYSCQHIEDYTGKKGIAKVLKNMGGLRARVIQGGTVKKGDRIRLL